MPLQPSQLLALLAAKQADFQNVDQDAFRVLKRYWDALARTAELSTSSLARAIAPLEYLHRCFEGLEGVGSHPDWVIPFEQVWENREQSLEWVRSRLEGIPTFAVDGSQIQPGRDLSIPVALIQVGWFENFHLPSGRYEKDAVIDLITPVELRRAESEEGTERLIHQRRFQAEVRRLIQYIQERPVDPKLGYYPGLVFYDGSLLATFAETFDSGTKQFYVTALRQLLRTSQQCRVPLVAYIDSSYARDLTVTLQHLYCLPEVKGIRDVQLFHSKMNWGDRTPLFRCCRPGILSQYREQVDQIGFTYLKTHAGYPVRLEMPVWMVEAGILDLVMDWVRGEVIIGGGYPYSIETADQVAVLQAEDRQIFYRLFQQWAETTQLNLRFSRKMVSKVRRR